MVVQPWSMAWWFNQETNDSFRRASSPPFQKPSATVGDPTSWVNQLECLFVLLQLVANGTQSEHVMHLRSHEIGPCDHEISWPCWRLTNHWLSCIGVVNETRKTLIENCTEHRIFIHSLDDIQGFWEWILAMKVKNRCQLLPNQSTWRLHIIIWHENQAMWDLLQSKNHPRSSTKRAKIIDLTVVGLIQHGCRVPHRGDSPWLHTETFAELNQPQKKWWALIQANHS